MNQIFQQFIDSLEPSFQKLISMRPVKITNLPKDMPHAGIYLFSEHDQPLYIGRTNRMRQRLQYHCRPSSSHNSATFAFRLAREQTGNLKATYVQKGSRSVLESNPEFSQIFKEQKARVRSMDIQFVAEQRTIPQALLEMYIAFCLETPYNDFDNH